MLIASRKTFSSGSAMKWPRLYVRVQPRRKGFVEFFDVNWKLWISFGTATLWSLAVAALLWNWQDIDAVLAVVFAVPFGWAFGIVLAPYPEELRKFEKWSSGIFGFFSGATLVKLYEWFDKLTDSQRELLLQQAILRRLAIGIASFLVTAIVVFISRNYAQPEGE
jgi:hypothetical protein